MKHLDKRPLLWLALGVVLIVASQTRFGLGALAWIAPVPWLRYLRLTVGWRARGVFVVALLLAWTGAFLKIVTAPIPPLLAGGFALPVGLLFALALLTHESLRRRAPGNGASLVFAALMVIAEWSLHGLLPFGTWGSAANTQLDQLALLQLASVTGLHGVSFLMYLFAAVLERALAGEGRSLRPWAWGFPLALLAVVSAGQARLAGSSSVGVDTVMVAAVGTDSLVGSVPDLPDAARLAEVERGLVARTEVAARAGAALVVWNEAATLVHPENEVAFLQRMAGLARKLGIDLVAAYVVPIQLQPLKYENKYVFLAADGSREHEYLKHHPVPGEPAVPGTAPMPVVVRGDLRIGGSICYDYDFPRRARANASVDLVALPSSDWRGIDPIHTEMARLRAIESGHSIIRSTRFGLSAGIDAYGRLRGFSSHADSRERVLTVRLPKAGVTTLYGRLGEWFPLACLLWALGFGTHALRRGRRRVVASGGGVSAVGGESGGACGV